MISMTLWLLLQDALKWPSGDVKWMPVWSWDEILSAGVHIFRQEEADIKERYGKWLGIARVVLQQTSQVYQESLDTAIRKCGVTTL